MEPVSPQTTTPVGNWNLPTALAHLESTIALHDRRYEQRFEAGQKQLDSALTGIREEIIHERNLREVIAEKVQLAQELKDAEILRRLEELNHSHKNAVENWRTSLPREMFEQWRKEHTEWKETVNLALVTKASTAAAVMSLDKRVDTIEAIANKLSGAFILVGVMGFAGVIALLLGLARLAGLVK